MHNDDSFYTSIRPPLSRQEECSSTKCLLYIAYIYTLPTLTAFRVITMSTSMVALPENSSHRKNALFHLEALVSMLRRRLIFPSVAGRIVLDFWLFLNRHSYF